MTYSPPQSPISKYDCNGDWASTHEFVGIRGDTVQSIAVRKGGSG